MENVSEKLMPIGGMSEAGKKAAVFEHLMNTVMEAFVLHEPSKFAVTKSLKLDEKSIMQSAWDLEWMGVNGQLLKLSIEIIPSKDITERLGDPTLGEDLRQSLKEELTLRNTASQGNA